MTGDINNGYEVFKTNCATCHQVRGMNGVSYGPDLGTVHNWLPKDLLASIMDPNSAISPGFELWEIELNNGENLQGIIKSETSSAISLKTAPEVEKTLNRQDIKAIKSLNNISLMPEIGDQLDQQAVADLIAFLRNSQVQSSY
jgi:putative heme-binding domain-containing protein